MTHALASAVLDWTGKIASPKQRQDPSSRPWYPYYAGYTDDFVGDIVRRLDGSDPLVILDPWNGSGTTTLVAAQHGHTAIGFDMNPAMILVAKGRHLPRSVLPSVQPIAAKVLQEAWKSDITADDTDLLHTWFHSESAYDLRRLQVAIDEVLVEHEGDGVGEEWSTASFSTLAGFFYTAAFVAVREILSPFRSSNPNWLNSASPARPQLEPSRSDIDELFHRGVDLLASRLQIDSSARSTESITLGNSERLPLAAESVDLILTSPPYCTRLDYAMATKGELAFLGASYADLRRLRELDFGSPVTDRVGRRAQLRPQYVEEVLDAVRQHESKASGTYYLAYYERYFAGLSRSISEIARVLVPGSPACLVVQDSHYKNVHIDLQRATKEIAECSGLSLQRRIDFKVPHTRASHNPRHRIYRDCASSIESLLIVA